MQVFKRARELSTFLKAEKSKGRTIGFVPTMGALHQGHISLVTRAKSENDLAVVSIFVNPTQFNSSEDLKRYPRVPEKDIAHLESLACDVVFLPEVNEMYPDKVQSEPIVLNGLDRDMEGKFRPGHFQGVATIVKRFFEIIQPHRAYFGEKDYQQFLVVKHITKSLGLGVEIVSHPTERSERGLALSSRNALLPEKDREASLSIFNILSWSQQNYRHHSPAEMREEIKKRFEKEPLTLEYVEICDAENLKPVQAWGEAAHVRIFIAAFAGGVRLIDNVSLF